jgi:hypothetical protein
MLGGHTGSETVGTTEGDVARLNATRHVVRLCCRIDNLVNCLFGQLCNLDHVQTYLHGKVDCHELEKCQLNQLAVRVTNLADGSQAGQSRSNSQTGKTRLCDWSIDDSLFAELIQQTF